MDLYKKKNLVFSVLIKHLSFNFNFTGKIRT